MQEPLTATEEKVYQYLIDYLAANSYQPSIREIGRTFDIKSTKTVSDVLGSLARKGYIQRNPSRSRGLKILGAHGGATRPVPVYAAVNAAAPVVTPAQRVDWITVDTRLVPSDEAFFVRVAQNGVHDCGIAVGDAVLVCPSRAADDAALVAVRAGDGVMIERAGADAPIGVICGVFHGAFAKRIGPTMSAD
jgi:repressor LexA